MAEADGCEGCYGVTFCGLYFNKIVTELYELVWSLALFKFSSSISLSSLHFYSLQQFDFPSRKSTFRKVRDCEGAVCLSLVQSKEMPQHKHPDFTLGASHNYHIPFLKKMKFKETSYKLMPNSFPRGIQGLL